MSDRPPNHSRRHNGARFRPLAEHLLRLIWKERRISRSEIARRTELARSTVSDIVVELLATRLVVEGGAGPSRGGRRPIVLEFVDDSFVILGVEVGAAHVAVVLTDLRGQVLASNLRDHDVREDPVGTRELVIELSEACLADAKRNRADLLGVGIGMPAPIDPAHPERVSEVVLPAWRGRSEMDVVGRHFGVPVDVDNDANLGALAEHWWGAGRGVSDFAYMKLATGVGAGIMIDGQVHRGATGLAGEIGHFAIDPNGALCVCGLRGCLATLVGRRALVKRAAELARHDRTSRLHDHSITVELLEDAALAGDPVALRTVEEITEALGIALSGVLNLINPALIVLGGDLARLGDLLTEPLRRNIRSRTLNSSVVAARVCTSEMGPHSIPVGAATMVLASALQDLNRFPAPAVRAAE